MREEATLLLVAQAFLLFFFLLPQKSEAQGFLPPLFSSSNNESCHDALCGQGTCEDSKDSILGFISGYTCNCKPGWTKLVDEIQFLPCVIPNCTTNFSCSNDTTAPAPSPSLPSNESSLFDPCLWALCGDGECVKTSILSHRCDCKPGYYNLMNNTIFPCFRKCSLSADCSQLGISLPGSSVSSPPNPTTDVTPPSNGAYTNSPDYTSWLMMHLMLLGLNWL